MPTKPSSTATPETGVNLQQQTLAITLAIGRIVHFVTPDLSQRAAIVTRVYGTNGHGDLGITSDTDGAPICDLVVFTTAEEHGRQGAAYGQGSVRYDASGQQGNTWHWPGDQHEAGSVTPAPGPEAGTGTGTGTGSSAGAQG